MCDCVIVPYIVYVKNKCVLITGTKCVDPNTGLIYFKYDFGYEFGILFPGEGHKFVATQWNKSQSTLPTSHQQNFVKGTGRKSLYPLAGGRDLVIPVRHERTATTPHRGTPSPINGGYYSDTDATGPYRGHSSSFRSVTPNLMSPSPSFATNQLRKRYSLPNTQVVDINIDRLHSGDSLQNLSSLTATGLFGNINRNRSMIDNITIDIKCLTNLMEKILKI